MAKIAAITERVECRFCKVFLGFARADGSGPFITVCQAKPATADCKTLVELEAKYAPKRRPTCINGCAGPIDEDAGSYGQIARRALEDSTTDRG